MAAAVDAFELTLGATYEPGVCETTERMQASAADAGQAARCLGAAALSRARGSRAGPCCCSHLLACPRTGLQVEATGLTASLLASRYEAAASDLRVTLHRAAGLVQLGGTLLALPFIQAPTMRLRCRCRQGREPARVTATAAPARAPALLPLAPARPRPFSRPCPTACRSFGVDWKLPGGRPAEQHHLFPTEPPPPGALQEPIYVSPGSARVAGGKRKSSGCGGGCWRTSAADQHRHSCCLWPTHAPPCLPPALAPACLPLTGGRRVQGGQLGPAAAGRAGPGARRRPRRCWHRRRRRPCCGAGRRGGGGGQRCCCGGILGGAPGAVDEAICGRNDDPAAAGTPPGPCLRWAAAAPAGFRVSAAWWPRCSLRWRRPPLPPRRSGLARSPCGAPPAPPCPAPLQLRQVTRRGSFFWRKPPSNIPKKGMGKMTRKASRATPGLDGLAATATTAAAGIPLINP